MPPKFKPGGKRFPPQSKPKIVPKQIVHDPSTDLANLSVSSGLDQEAENQFELELCWCIQQLQMSLDSGKLVEKQALDIVKTMNLLKSSSVPLVRKRQVMRNTFGDYRTKMIQDEKKHGKYVSTIKFGNLQAEKKKFVFVRKAASDSNSSNVNKESESRKSDDTNKAKKICILGKESSDEPFKFNFNNPPESEDSKADKMNQAKKVCIMSREPSDVPFKFNFNPSESE